MNDIDIRTPKGKRQVITIWSFAIIFGHIAAYYNNFCPIDQLIPAIVGYISIWGVMMGYEFDEPKELEIKKDAGK